MRTGGLPYPRVGRPRGRPAQRRADGDRGLRRRAARAAPCRRARLLRPRRRLATRTRRGPTRWPSRRRSLGPQPDPRAPRGATACFTWPPRIAADGRARPGQTVAWRRLRRLLESKVFALAEASPACAGPRRRRPSQRTKCAASSTPTSGSRAWALSQRNGAVMRQRAAGGHRLELALKLLRAGLGAQLGRGAERARGRASASARRARSFQSPGPVATPGILPSHFSDTAHVRLDPPLGIAREIERVVVDDLRSAVTTFLPASRTCRQMSKS